MSHTLFWVGLVVNMASKLFTNTACIAPKANSQFSTYPVSTHASASIRAASRKRGASAKAAGGVCLIIQLLDGHVEAVVHQPLAGALVVAVQAIDEAASLAVWQGKINVEGGPSCQSCSVSSVDID